MAALPRSNRYWRKAGCVDQRVGNFISGRMGSSMVAGRHVGRAGNPGTARRQATVLHEKVKRVGLFTAIIDNHTNTL